MSVNYSSENKSVTEILESELSLNGVSDFFIQSRVKSSESIKKKQSKKYGFGQQKEITDYSGVRIIVNRLQDIRRCIEFIVNRFQIDYRNSNFNPNSFIEDKEFGYQSSHIVIITHDLKTEIQIRTLAQHIWASTSHNLDYKSPVKDSIFLRKLFRLSGLLEQIDIITEDLYQSSPKQNQSSLKSLGALDYYSLEYYLSRKERIFSLICIGFERKSSFGTSPWFYSMKILDGSNVLASNNKESLDLILFACGQLEIKTIENLKLFLEENRIHIRKIAEAYKSSELFNGRTQSIMSLFYFLITFIPESNLDELLNKKAHPNFIKNLKEFVRQCDLSLK